MSFFQKVRQGVNSAASEAERQATIARLSLDANGAKNNLRKKFEEVGETSVKLIRADELSHPAIAAMLDEIASLESHLAEIEAHIAEVRAGDKASL